jgi:hypothetical protein
MLSPITPTQSTGTSAQACGAYADDAAVTVIWLGDWAVLGAIFISGRRVGGLGMTDVLWSASLADASVTVIFTSASGRRLRVGQLGALPAWQMPRRPSAPRLPHWQTALRPTTGALAIWQTARRPSSAPLPHGQPVKRRALRGLPDWQAAPRQPSGPLPTAASSDFPPPTLNTTPDLHGLEPHS